MKIGSNPFAIASLLISNMVPLVGVLWGGWSASTIILLYWFESAVIGYFTIKKLRITEQKGLPGLGAISFSVQSEPNTNPMDNFLSSFFMLHFGIFMFVHLIFLLIFFLRPDLNFWGLLLSACTMTFSHWLSYQQNFIQTKEYLHKTADNYFWSPYPRIIAMHLAVILGGVYLLQQGQSVVTLAILVGVKTVADLGSHIFEHRV